MSTRRFLMAAGSLSLLVPFTRPVRADKTADARQAIQSICHQIDDAMSKGDLKAPLRFQTQDFVSVMNKGRVQARAQIEAQTKNHTLRPGESIEAKTTIETFALQGQTANVTMSRHVKMIVLSPNTHRPNLILHDSREQSLWTKTEGTWLMKRSKLLVGTITINGRLVASRRGR
jgi:ketosteroid isomerase-like protein